METRTLPPVSLACEVPSIVMRDVSWADYEAMLRIIGERTHLRQLRRRGHGGDGAVSSS